MSLGERFGSRRRRHSAKRRTEKIPTAVCMPPRQLQPSLQLLLLYAALPTSAKLPVNIV